MLFVIYLYIVLTSMHTRQSYFVVIFLFMLFLTHYIYHNCAIHSTMSTFHRHFIAWHVPMTGKTFLMCQECL